jgi:glycine/D-amino acid oxidase-like deaminating enzyme
MSKQYIVVGGGIAGLTCAVALALKGASVALYEQSRHLGGRAATQHQKGFALNLGPHALYRNGPLYRVLRDWQIPFTGHVPKLKGGVFLVAEWRKYAFPTDTVRLFLTGALGIGEKFAAARALQLLTSEKPVNAATMREWVDRYVPAGRARQLVEALVRLTSYSNDLTRLSASAAIKQVQAGVKNGVVYLDGGWETLVNGLAAKARSLGVKIFEGAPVGSIDGGAVHLADGTRVQSNGTILAVTPDAVARLTGAELRALAPARLACLDLGLRSIPTNCGQFALGLDQPIYFSMHSTFAALAPDGGALVHIGKYLAPGAHGTREELEDFAELVMPGWRAHAEVARFLPDITVTYGLPTPEGRPDVNAIAIPGVAIAGDWVGGQAMLADAAAASALRAADFIGAPVAAQEAVLCAAQ